MSTAETKLGRIEVSRTAIARIAGQAASSTYGVVGIAPINLAKEVAQQNIVVNCISPALIETRIVEEMGEAQRKILLSKIPVGRFGKTSEVAALVKFLVSDECAFSTGQCYDISGGRAVY